MRKRRFNNFLLIIFFICSTKQNLAQQFSYKASLGEVEQTSFYKIVLPPQINAKTQISHFDLRIEDEQKKEVAYLIEQEQANFIEKNFIEFPILFKTKEKDKQTHIKIENISGSPINDLLLITANMQAKRIVNISGSNNLNEWFIIKENVWLDNYFKANSNTVIQSISLPSVNYKYFQITILGEDILPVNIIKTGIYKENYAKGKYATIPNPLIKQIDSADKKSYVQLSFDESYTVDKLIIEIEGPKFFKRWINIFSGKFVNSKFPYSANLSTGVNELFLSGFKSKDILLQINNEDNQPLKIKSVQAFQLQNYLVSYLEKGKKYNLLFGDSFAVKPNYDLDLFKDSIGVNIPLLAVNSVEGITPNLAAQIPPKNNNKLLLWITITAISILLLLFCYKIIQDINKKQ
jgi:hypothetical protein